MSFIDAAVRLLDTTGAELFDPAEPAYELVSISEGARVWRRATAASRFVAGAAQTAATLDMTSAVVVWLVNGTTDGQLRGRINALRDVLGAFQFRAEVDLQGVVEVWDCWCADTAVGDGGQYEKFRLHSRMQVLTATIPRQPVPLSTTGVTL